MTPGHPITVEILSIKALENAIVFFETFCLMDDFEDHAIPQRTRWYSLPFLHLSMELIPLLEIFFS
jgi:hypothetical protein